MDVVRIEGSYDGELAPRFEGESVLEEADTGAYQDPQARHLVQDAFRFLSEADGLLLLAGIGIAAEAGLPDLRSDAALSREFPQLSQQHLRLSDLASPAAFRLHPHLAWGFYGERLRRARTAPDNRVTRLLRELRRELPHEVFIYTTVVDGLFQNAGFDPDRVIEAHGSLHRFQCLNACSADVWEADAHIEVDADTLIAERLPTCPHCGGPARPHILMFGDSGWVTGPFRQAVGRFDSWRAGIEKLACFDLTADASAVLSEFEAHADSTSLRLDSQLPMAETLRVLLQAVRRITPPSEPPASEYARLHREISGLQGQLSFGDYGPDGESEEEWIQSMTRTHQLLNAANSRIAELEQTVPELAAVRAAREARRASRQIIVEVAGEGGGYELYGWEDGPGSWRFCTDPDPFLDLLPIATNGEAEPQIFVDNINDAIRLLPPVWLRLHPLRVHREFARVVLEAARSAEESMYPPELAWYWQQACIAGVVEGLREASEGGDQASQRLLDDIAHNAGWARTATAPTSQAELQIDRIHLNAARTLVDWYTLIGQSDAAILAQPPEWAPASVHDAQASLAKVTAGELSRRHQGASLGKLLNGILDDLTDRERFIAAQRTFAEPPRTLADLGQELGLTRERVRQLEEATLTKLLLAVEGGPLDETARIIWALCDPVITLDALTKFIPSLADTVPAVGQPVWRVVQHLYPGYEVKDGWAAVGSLRDAKELTDAVLIQMTDEYGVAITSDLGDLNRNLESGHQAPLWAAWLRSRGYVADESHVFTQTRSIGDRTAAILSVEGSPLTTEQVAEILSTRFDNTPTLRSLRNALGVDPRVVRVDRDRWALADWGLPAYEGIRAAIANEIERAGGEVPIDLLVELITGAFSVTEASVRTYAQAPPFSTSAGMVFHLKARRVLRRGPERTARLFRRADSWLYRIRINSDHLRGSGFPAATGIATLLNLDPGQQVELAGPGGRLLVSWNGPQPTFGSIRWLLSPEVNVGKQAFLVIGDDRTVGLEVLAAPTGDPLHDAAILVGAPPDVTDKSAGELLREAISLGHETPRAQVIEAYRMRGDTDVARLLTDVSGTEW